MELALAFAGWCFLVCSLKGVGGYRIPDQYGLDEPFTVSELYPSCVDILDVWPTPNSVLKPFREETLFTDYIVQLWFTRPLEVQLDSVVSLSVTTTCLLNFLPIYATYFGGSERNLLVYFRIPNYFKFARLVGSLWLLNV